MLLGLCRGRYIIMQVIRTQISLDILIRARERDLKLGTINYIGKQWMYQHYLNDYGSIIWQGVVIVDLSFSILQFKCG